MEALKSPIVQSPQGGPAAARTAAHAAAFPAAFPAEDRGVGSIQRAII